MSFIPNNEKVLTVSDGTIVTHWFRFREIKVSNPYPPIPIRTHDWCAHFDDDGEEAGKYGYGATQQEAIDDLKTTVDTAFNRL